MPRYTDLTDSKLRPIIIRKLAENNTSLTYRKQLANELNVRVDFVNNVYNHSKIQINELRTEIYEEQHQKQGVINQGAQIMQLENKPNPPVEEVITEEPEVKSQDDYTPRTKEDMEANKRLTDAQKEHIAHEIEDSSEIITYNNDEVRRYISLENLKRIADRNFITIMTAERYTKEYTTVKVDKEHRFCRTPDSEKKNLVPQEIKDVIDDLLRTTLLSQKEIADIAGSNQGYVSYYYREKVHKRPKEDDEVKRKTAKKRKELRKVRNEQESRERRQSENNSTKKPEEVTTKIKDIVPEITVTENKQEKSQPKKIYSCSCGYLGLEKFAGIKCEICGTICSLVDNNVTVEKVTPAKKEEPVDQQPVVEEKKEEEVVKAAEYEKPVIIDILRDNKNLHRVLSKAVLECVLVDGRHIFPCQNSIYETLQTNNEIDKDLLFNYDQQEEVCRNFLKSNIEFNEEGIADKSIKCYCTGVQGPLISFIKVADEMKVNVTFLHYDLDNKIYHSQDYSTDKYPTSHDFGPGMKAISQTFGGHIYRYKCTTRDIENCTNNLFIFDCVENMNDISRCRKTAIICTRIEEYKELFKKMSFALIDHDINNFTVNVYKFNFNTAGEVIKNTVIKEFKC